MLEANEMKVQRKKENGKTKIDRTRNQQIRQSLGIQATNQWVERRRRRRRRRRKARHQRYGVFGYHVYDSILAYHNIVIY